MGFGSLKQVDYQEKQLTRLSLVLCENYGDYWIGAQGIGGGYSALCIPYVNGKLYPPNLTILQICAKLLVNKQIHFNILALNLVHGLRIIGITELER